LPLDICGGLASRAVVRTDPSRRRNTRRPVSAAAKPLGLKQKRGVDQQLGVTLALYRIRESESKRIGREAPSEMISLTLGIRL
jgi:hypothetical protein